MTASGYPGQDNSEPRPWLHQPLQHNSLRYLAWYMFTLLGVMLLTSYAFASQHISLPGRVYWLLTPTQALLALSTLIAHHRGNRVNVALYLALLLGSILLLGWYLYDSGGHTNPVISILLVPLAMSAALLGWQAT